MEGIGLKNRPILAEQPQMGGKWLWIKEMDSSL
jgi:hypothetical protein